MLYERNICTHHGSHSKIGSFGIMHLENARYIPTFYLHPHILPTDDVMSKTLCEKYVSKACFVIICFQQIFCDRSLFAIRAVLCSQTNLCQTNSVYYVWQITEIDIKLRNSPCNVNKNTNFFVTHAWRNRCSGKGQSSLQQNRSINKH